MNAFDNSLGKALESTYPHRWNPWKFYVSSVFWKNDQNVRRYFDWLASEENFDLDNDEEWFKIDEKKILVDRGSNVLDRFGGSLGEALECAYPGKSFPPWLFSTGVSSSYWKTKENRLRYMEFLRGKLNIVSNEQWYGVLNNDILYYGGKSFLDCYDRSLYSALMDLYPEISWNPLQFRSSLKNKKTHRGLLDVIGTQLKISKPEDWYDVDPAALKNEQLIKKYQGSLCKTLQSIMPEIEWQPWRFRENVRGFWQQLDNQRLFMDYISKELNIIDQRDWKRVSLDDIKSRGGASLVQLYGGSLSRILDTVYPNIEWKIRGSNDEVTIKTPRNYWDNIENQREQMDLLATKLGIKTRDDWYRIKKEDVIDEIGGLIKVIIHAYKVLIHRISLEVRLCNDCVLMY